MLLVEVVLLHEVVVGVANLDYTLIHKLHQTVIIIVNNLLCLSLLCHSLLKILVKGPPQVDVQQVLLDMQGESGNEYSVLSKMFFIPISSVKHSQGRIVAETCMRMQKDTIGARGLLR